MNLDAAVSFEDEIALLRGRITGSFAQIEFLLVSLIAQCGRRPEYRTLARFPHKLEQKLALVHRLSKAPGPLRMYRDRIVAATRPVREFSRIRNIAAHGLVISPDANRLEKRSFRMIEGEAVLITETANLDQLRRSAETLEAYAEEAALLLSLIDLSPTSDSI